MKSTVTMLGLLMGLTFTSGSSFAQPPPAPTLSEGSATNDVVHRFSAVRAKVLREKAGLSDEKAAQVEQLMDASHEKRRGLQRTMRENNRILMTLIETGSDDQQAYAQSLEALFQARQQMGELKSQELQALRGFLTPKEQALVLIEMRKMRQKAKQMFQERRGGRSDPPRLRGRGRGGGQGPPGKHGGGPPAMEDDAAL